MDYLDLAIELLTVSELHRDSGNTEYANALRHTALEATNGIGTRDYYTRVLCSAENAIA